MFTMSVSDEVDIEFLVYLVDFSDFLDERDREILVE